MGEVTPRRRFVARLALAALAAAGLSAVSSRPSRALSTVDTGVDTSYGNSRKLIQNDWGYWVFYNNGNDFSYAFSPDGVSWTPSANVFDSAANLTFIQGSIWYQNDGS